MAVEAIDRQTWDLLRRLAAAGVIQFTGGAETLHRSGRLDDDGAAAADVADRAHRRALAADWLAQAERKRRMAGLLADGGFAAEALAPLGDAAALALRALAVAVDRTVDPAEAETAPPSDLVTREAVAARLPPGTIAALEGDDTTARRAAVGNLMVAAGAL
ncbi:MAG: hypothetical protein HQL40_18200 [Alphaproteobacteria bacterium]|nr:hypothetical protein [Alphaproteobacteria bacterium]